VPEALDGPDVPEVPVLGSRRSPRVWLRRIPAIVCLLGCIAATLVILAEGRNGSVDAAAPGLQEAARPAWKATGALSAELNGLKRGTSRGPARHAAHEAVKALKTARTELPKVVVPTSQGDVFAVTEVALRAQAAWVDAVGSTLANPRSPRRADLARLAATAMRRSAAAERFGVADGPAVAGTGHLLSATKPG
jgi:hypothetical protein